MNILFSSCDTFWRPVEIFASFNIRHICYCSIHLIYSKCKEPEKLITGHPNCFSTNLNKTYIVYKATQITCLLRRLDTSMFDSTCQIDGSHHSPLISSVFVSVLLSVRAAERWFCSWSAQISRSDPDNHRSVQSLWVQMQQVSVFISSSSTVFRQNLSDRKTEVSLVEIKAAGLSAVRQEFLSFCF